MGEIKWIKLTTDMFDNRKIRHLRRLPEGNNIVLIWVMLLTMAGRCNAGGMIFLTENIPYTPKMLADELSFEESTVVLALKSLEQLGMIYADNGFFSIAGWQEHQNIEGMEKVREQNRLRKQRQREKDSLLLESHVTSRDSHATDIDIEEDIDIDNIKRKKYIKKEKEPFHPPTLEDVEEYCQSRNNGIDAQHFIDYYTARGWMLGKEKMKDWKAAVRTWEKRNKEKPDEHKWNVKYDNE